MATYNFLDYNGLKRVLQQINAYYASKEAVSSEFATQDTQLADLRTLVSQLQTALDQETQTRTADDIGIREEIRALASALQERLGTLEGNLTNEQASRESVDTGLQAAIDTEIADRESAIQNLSSTFNSALNNLGDALTSNLTGYVTRQLENLNLEGVKDIILLNSNNLPVTGARSFLYITPDHAIHQWIGDAANPNTEHPEQDWKTLGEDSAAEILALANRVTTVEGQVSELQSGLSEGLADVSAALDDKVATADYEAALGEIDQSITALESGLETAIASKLSGITVNDEPVSVENGIAAITIEASGSDPELRQDFEAFQTQTTNQITLLNNAMATAEALEGHETASNPHNITKETLGLDKVENYSPTEIQAPLVEALETKASITAMDTALAAKIAYTDVIDDLVTPETEKPLSANQGVVLDEKIQAVNTKVTSLGSAIIFKGTVASYENLPVSAALGDCYQIYSNSQDPHHGETYAKTETGWVQIVTSTQDLSSLIASPADVNKIILDFE